MDTRRLPGTKRATLASSEPPFRANAVTPLDLEPPPRAPIRRLRLASDRAANAEVAQCGK